MDHIVTPDQPMVAALRTANVVALFVFGSQTTGRSGPLSDTDVGVLLREPVDPTRSLDQVASLEPLVEQLLPNARRLELTILNTAPVSLQLEVLRRGKPLIVIGSLALAIFRERVMQRAGDLLPMIRAYRADRIRSQYA